MKEKRENKKTSYKGQRDNKTGFKKNFNKQGGKKKFGKKPPKKNKKMPDAVKKIMQENNLTPALAYAVASNRMPIEEALEEMKLREARREEGKKICEKYEEISFSLACLLVKEGITPEQFFEKQKEKLKKLKQKALEKKGKMEKDEAQKSAYKELERYIENKTPIVLAKYRGFFEKGFIKDFTPYEFDFQAKDKSPLIHRLEMKYMCEESHFEKIQKWIVVDKSIKQKKILPSHKKNNRFNFPEGLLEVGAEIILALHEGEMIRGKIEWFTPYDIMLKISNMKVWIFCHSILECSKVRKPVNKR